MQQTGETRTTPIYFYTTPPYPTTTPELGQGYNAMNSNHTPMILLTAQEKAAIRDARREARIALATELRKLNAPEHVFDLLRSLTNLEQIGPGALYEGDPIDRNTYSGALATAGELAHLLGLEMHPLDDLGFVISMTTGV